MKKIIFLFVILFCIANTCSAFVGSIDSSGEGLSLPTWPGGLIAGFVAGLLFYAPVSKFQFSLGGLSVLFLIILTVIAIYTALFQWSTTPFTISIVAIIIFLLVAVLGEGMWYYFLLISSVALFAPSVAWFVFEALGNNQWELVIFTIFSFFIGNILGYLLKKNKAYFAL